jgi:hypothetical protein
LLGRENLFPLGIRLGQGLFIFNRRVGRLHDFILGRLLPGGGFLGSSRWIWRRAASGNQKENSHTTYRMDATHDNFAKEGDRFLGDY